MQRETIESFTPYVLRSIAVSPPPGWSKNVMPSTTAPGYLSHECERMSGVNGCQGTPWSEELDPQELRGAPGGERDLELRGSAVSWNIVDLESTHLSISTTCGIILIIKGWCSPFVPLYTPKYSVFLSRSVPLCIQTCAFRKKFASPNPCVAILAIDISATAVLSGTAVSKNSRSSYSWPVFELGTIISFTTT